MLRTQVYLTAAESQGLSSLAKATGKKQSELIRAAIDRHLAISQAEVKRTALAQCAGLWKNRTDLPDFGEIRKGLDHSSTET